MKKTPLALGLVVASLLSSPAYACLNEVLKHDAALEMLAGAQTEVDRGELGAAREHAMKAIAGRFEWDDKKSERLVSRAIRIRSLADVRDPEAGAVALHDAEDNVGRIRREHDSDPVLDAEYGEILARLPGRADDAHAILSPLAKRDLVGSPWALAALSRVSKDPNEAKDAQLACVRVGGEPWLCGDKVAAQQKWYGPIAKPNHAAISIGFVAGGAALVLGVSGALALVIVKRRRRIAAALAA